MIKINLSLLGNVFSKVSDIKNNLTSTDTNKPLSAAQGKELKTQVDTKVNKVTGKELSSNDFTDSLKNKLENDVLSANFGYIDEDLKIHFTVASLDLNVDNNIIQQGEKTDVQATLTDDKEEPIEDIRVNFYEIYTPIINLSGNSIIQSGQRADITAKVKDSDESIVTGETVYFFESTTYRCIGKGVTDDNGIAHITHSSNDNGATFTQSASNGYLGTGKGQVGVIASMDKKLVDGSIVSEPCSILDTVFYDEGKTGSPSVTWYTNGLTLERQADGSLLTCSETWKRITPISNDTYFTRPFAVEFDIVSITGQLVVAYAVSGGSNKYDYLDSTGHFKYLFNSDSITRQKTGGNPTTLENITGALKISLFLTNTSHEVKIANFKVYPI